LKNNGGRSSRCFKPFWIETAPAKCLPIYTLIHV
jgi:hypothetical protein